MKYVFFLYDHYAFPLALQLKSEGNEVIIGMVEKVKDLKVDGLKISESPEDRKNRLECCDGMLEKKTQKEVMDYLSKAEDKDDHFLFFEHNDAHNIVEEVLKLGYRNGMFPTSLYYRLEKERELGKKVVQKFYDPKKVKVAEYFTFEKVPEGIKHIQDSKDTVWVLKSNGTLGKTVVPKTDDVEIAKKQIIDTLTKYKSDYESGGYTLEVKIPDAYEVCPVLVFWNGEPIYSIAEFECKEFGAGNIGIQKGGNLVASVVTPLDCELNKIAFPEIVYKLASKQPGLSVYDAGLMFDGKDFYFTEFCGMRYGFDGIFSEVVLRDEGKPFVGAYFEDIMKGKSPVRNKFGVAVRLFNIEGKAEETRESKGDLPLVWDKSVENNLFLYRVKKGKDGIVSVAGMDFFGAMTAAGDTLKEAVDRVYDKVDQVDFEKLYYRPSFDFLSTDYRGSIPNRIKKIGKFLSLQTEEN
jgi:phosphoribosylamine-glycine ligase